MRNELEMADLATQAVVQLLVDDHIACLYADAPPQSDDRAHDWTVKVRTAKGMAFMFYMAGHAVDGVGEVVSTQGRRLIGKHNPIDILARLSGSETLALNQVLLTALAQTYPEFAHLK